VADHLPAGEARCIVAGSILVFIPAHRRLCDHRAILGGGKNMMLGNLIELQFGSGAQLATGGSDFRSPLMAIVMVALLVYVRNTAGSEVRHG
jgi:spermidine/putrescine transport system permease protein